MSEESNFDETMAKLMRNSPIASSYLITLWVNFFADPAIKKAEEYGLARDEFTVLLTLVDVGPLTATEICMLSLRPKNSISRAVNSLHNRRMITRTPDATDRRKALLKVTAKGRSTYETVLSFFIQRQTIMLQSLTSTERRTLEALMKKMILGSQPWRTD